jgi:UDP-N-acetyl-D-galactosamine dehydrogenase
MKIDTQAVLDAAGSKWNFLPFKPGLVGGHCIGVDPYYLTSKAISIGYKPKIILAGRDINDKMGTHVALEFIKKFKEKKIKVKGSKILIMGLTFKENCADIRNSGVEKVIKKLRKFDCRLDLYDPWANIEDVKKTYKIFPITKLNRNRYDGILISVAHKKFKSMGLKYILGLCKKKHVIYDLKYLFSNSEIDLRL